MAFSFGSTSTPNTGFGAASKPTFSFGSTNTATTSTAGFSGFGTTSTSSGFGAFGTVTSTAAPFGTLGAATTTTPSLFSGIGFGATTAKPAGFGTNTFGTNTFGTGTGFGAGTSTFGSSAPTFGTNTFGTGSTFGSTFGTKTTTSSGFGGFGTGLGATPAFGQQQQQQPQQQQGPTNAHEALVAAVFNCNVFGDERDQVLAKWNLLQAQWGTGQAYYSRNAHPLELNEQNPLCRFKAVGYSRLGGKEDKDGHVAMVFNKPEQEVKNNQQALCTSLSGLLGNKPNLAVNIESIKAVSENKSQAGGTVGGVGEGGCGDCRGSRGCRGSGGSGGAEARGRGARAARHQHVPLLRYMPPQTLAFSFLHMNWLQHIVEVVMYVVDKNSGSHVGAGELAGFLSAGSARMSLSSAAVMSVCAVTRPPRALLDQYLQTPPPGMDMRLWKQAQADNPDPENYIPVPIIGFSEIKFRARCQAEEAALQAGWLRRAADTLAELRTRRAAATAALERRAAALHALRHRLLQVIARQEVVGRVGVALSLEEEAARARLQELASQLTAPPLYNGRLNELLCAVRLQRSSSAGAVHERYQLDPGAQEDVKQFLSLQQRGMAHLMDTVKEDLSALNIITEGMSRLVRT